MNRTPVTRYSLGFDRVYLSGASLYSDVPLSTGLSGARRSHGDGKVVVGNRLMLGYCVGFGVDGSVGKDLRVGYSINSTNFGFQDPSKQCTVIY